ncbi:SNF2 domain-containing protein / helicase domain-containing protein / F-box family protein [Perilla frutescens var. hirtella]|uniref:SNF2 domain-containing protein / helicase domain-containing protein / F-box family protein n=1 Tax=Perilla frutescens var. hirtella TaxID=608512 RepID=A0AAD4P371_PERFH|nr:SNF2 domain-containing protein / helicase domain-containing protein / F-box family protein [Perilla frutescens var. hirtella]
MAVNSPSRGGWKSAIFIIFVEVAERFAYYGVAGNLFMYLTKVLGQPTAAAAKNVNTWQGVSALFPVVGGFLADSYVGRFKTILISSIIYLFGLILLTLAVSTVPPHIRHTVFFIALYILTVGEGGHKPCVQTFAADQFDESIAEEKAAKSSFFNWWSYRQQAPVGSPFTRVAQVVVAAFRKRRLSYTDGRGVCVEDDEGRDVIMEGGAGGGIQTLARTNQFRFLDKATMIDERDAASEKRDPWRLSSVNQVEETKLVFQLIPIWFSCLMFAVVIAQLSTFFTKQTSTLNRSITASFTIPAASFQVITGVTILASVLLYERALVPFARALTGHYSGITMLQRIGIGLLLSTLTMAVAALVETRRVRVAGRHGLLDSPAAVVPMAAWWMVPQYVLIGMCDVFAVVGLQELFYDQMPAAMRSVGAAAYITVTGVGSFLSGGLISVVQGLCGYLCGVLTVPADASVSLNSFCRVAGETSDVYFAADDGARLTPIGKSEAPDSKATLSAKKRWSRIGMVNGSISVVHQLHALAAHKCLRILARVVHVSSRESEVEGGSGREIRAVVLVDVYLPMALWSGWQFPRSSSTAAALFKHLSCDWEARSSMLKCTGLSHDADCSIWNVTDCHVLGCKRHCIAPNNPNKKKAFELQEIFKSLPCVTTKVHCPSSRVMPADSSNESGIWALSDDILIIILTALSPSDLVKISLTCHHLRFLAASIMPCMKLKLYPHQQAAVEWMLERERDSKVLQHPLYMSFKTEDGFDFNINMVSGEIVTSSVPTIRDFHGGMFCDEPGLGKTITALSLLLKTQGTLAEAPDAAQLTWCLHNGSQRCGYYEVSADNANKGCVSDINKIVGQKARRGKLSLDELTPKKNYSGHASNPLRRLRSSEPILEPADLSSNKRVKLYTPTCSLPTTSITGCSRSRSNVKRNLLEAYEEPFSNSNKSSKNRKHANKGHEKRISSNQAGFSRRRMAIKRRDEEMVIGDLEYNETWVQCDACGKWRKVADEREANTSTAWFCSMNSDPSYQSCNVLEESWDYREPIMCLPGFHAKGSSGGQEENILFFTSVLKEHYTLINAETKKALTWLAKLPPFKLIEMETMGLVSPTVGTSLFDTRVARDYHKIFEAFGLVKKVEKDVLKWYYPGHLLNLTFDLDALRAALCEPLDSLRFYLSSATLVVVPSNLVEHWKTQIERHVRPGQLRVYIWGDQKKKPSVHNLAWDYDVVITTFSRLSAEWTPRRRSVLMQVHWLRVMLDEGHTLGSSLSLTNKLQMVVSLVATNRWLLTGTPTPNTPSSQLSYLQPMLRFLKEDPYGRNQKLWEAGIIRPFEAEMEEGRSRLLQLLNRCMISARKIDLKAIPPCIKRVTFVDFSEEHAKSYNELVETVRRNILMADWNDSSHIESLLNPKQWKFRAATIKNVRLSCCVAGHVRVTDAGQDIQETMDILVENGLDPMSQEYGLVKYSLSYGGNCVRCKEWCRLPVIAPCTHLLCLDCVALDSERCTLPGCGYLYEMQTPEELARPENPNPKWPVPKDLIELQPSYKQDDWNPDWQSTSSSKVTYLVHQLKQLQESNMLIGCPAENREVMSNDISFSSKSSCSNISLDQQACHYSRNGRCQNGVEKVIVFSQFLEHIHIIEQQLSIAGIQFAGMYSPMPSGNKMKSLATFQHDPSCMALLMDGSAALGLDLSFVTHVYLMEPIWDRSMEEQVISRAHRMGATRPIHVETLAMSGTIEEQMLKFLQDGDECRRLLKGEFDTNDCDLDGARSCRTLHDFAESNYLARLSFVRTNPRPT